MTMKNGMSSGSSKEFFPFAPSRANTLPPLMATKGPQIKDKKNSEVCTKFLLIEECESIIDSTLCKSEDVSASVNGPVRLMGSVLCWVVAGGFRLCPPASGHEGCLRDRRPAQDPRAAHEARHLDPPHLGYVAKCYQKIGLPC